MSEQAKQKPAAQVGEAELKPCPFCDAYADNFEDGEIQCSNRKCEVRPHTFSKEAWNTRAAALPADAASINYVVKNYGACITHGVVDRAHRCRDYDGEELGMSIHRIKTIAAALPAADALYCPLCKVNHEAISFHGRKLAVCPKLVGFRDHPTNNTVFISTAELAKLSAVDAVTDATTIGEAEAERRAREIVKSVQGCEWHGPIASAHCADLHEKALIQHIAAALRERGEGNG